MGMRRGLVEMRWGMPEKKRVLEEVVLWERMGWEGGRGMGRVVCGVERAGKWERRGVRGGGGVRPNSGAREVRGVDVGERVMRRFV